MGKERLIEADIFNAKAHAFTDSPIEFKGKLREVLDLTLASNHERAIFIASLSGVVEPMAAVIGAGVVILAQPILPYALGFAAGAMIFVVVKELVPES